MVKMFGRVDDVINWATPLFAAIGILSIVFLGSFMYLWGLTTGVVLFTAVSVIMVVLQLMHAIDLWKAPWMVLLPPSLILVGYAGQYYSLFSVAPALYGTPVAMLTLADYASIAMWTVAISIIVAVVVGLILTRKR